MNNLSKITNHDSIASHSDVQLPIAIQGPAESFVLLEEHSVL